MNWFELDMSNRLPWQAVPLTSPLPAPSLGPPSPFSAVLASPPTQTAPGPSLERSPRYPTNTPPGPREPGPIFLFRQHPFAVFLGPLLLSSPSSLQGWWGEGGTAISAQTEKWRVAYDVAPPRGVAFHALGGGTRQGFPFPLSTLSRARL